MRSRPARCTPTLFGTLVGFGLIGSAIASEGVSHTRQAAYDQQGNPECTDGSSNCYGDVDKMVCEDWVTTTYRVPRFDYVWWMLSANPFVILGDATPTRFDSSGNPDDMFGWLKTSVRSAQIPPELEQTWDECDPANYQNPYSGSSDYRTPEQIISETVPSWSVGLGVQLALTALLLWWAWARTRTPARTLPPGTRIA